MKRLLVIFSAFFCSLACTAQITSDGDVYFRTGGIVKYDQPKIWAAAEFHPIFENIKIRLLVVDATKDTEVLDEVYLVATKSEIAAYTGTGDDELEAFLDAVYQYVIDYLENVPENSGITFSL